MLAVMSHWVTPDGFLSSTPGVPSLTNGHVGPAFDATFYAIAGGVIAVLIVVVVVCSIARHVGVALRTGRRRVAVRDRAAPRAHSPQ
jgi:hypothetical protein